MNIIERFYAQLQNKSYQFWPWWLKDSLGWPIEIYKGKLFKSLTRIVFQNISKIVR
jgi:hypothetical protein